VGWLSKRRQQKNCKHDWHKITVYTHYFDMGLFRRKKWGYAYRCLLCGKRDVFTDSEMEAIKAKMYPAKGKRVV